VIYHQHSCYKRYTKCERPAQLHNCCVLDELALIAKPVLLCSPSTPTTGSSLVSQSANQDYWYWAVNGFTGTQPLIINTPRYGVFVVFWVSAVVAVQRPFANLPHHNHSTPRTQTVINPLPLTTRTKTTDIDNDTSSFSQLELKYIVGIWRAVVEDFQMCAGLTTAEMSAVQPCVVLAQSQTINHQASSQTLTYAPILCPPYTLIRFDVDITTEEPQVSLLKRGQRIIIGGRSDCKFQHLDTSKRQHHCLRIDCWTEEPCCLCPTLSRLPLTTPPSSQGSRKP